MVPILFLNVEDTLTDKKYKEEGIRERTTDSFFNYESF